MELKFRAWDKDRKIMIQPSEFDSNIPLMNFFGNCYNDGKLLNYVMMQFIGLKDNNGIDIYEGDLVQSSFISENMPKITGRPIEVRRDKDGTGFFPFISGCGGCDREEMKAIYDQKAYRYKDFGYYIVEIVGNKYEKTDKV